MTTIAADSLKLSPPVLRQTGEGLVAGLSIDRVLVDGAFLGVSGWAIGAQDLTFTAADGANVSMFPSLTFYPRDDVAAGYGIAGDRVTGFLATWRNRPNGDLQVRLSYGEGEPLGIDLRGPEQSPAGETARFLTEHLSRSDFLFESLVHDPAALSLLINHLRGPLSAFQRARGHIEMAKGIEGVGGLVVGWTVGEPDIRFRLVDDAGAAVLLDNAARWTRPDIVEAMNRDFGDYTFNAGFLQRWAGSLNIGGRIRLVASTDEASFLMSDALWSAAPLDPVGFARWSFEMPTPRESFAERLAHHDGPIIDALIERRTAKRRTSAPVMREYGRLPSRPKCSVVVPLYGRHDFLLNQLLAFSDDPDFASGVELNYVIDDHRLVSPLAADTPMFEASFGVSFRTIWSGDNRGFSGATNLGVVHSRAPFVLLMNSDVIPVAPGWLERMRSVLAAHPRIGMLGARLHYPNGAVQHDGMEFHWDPTLRSHVNRHPGAGRLPATPSGAFVPRQAVTGACVMMKRELYDAVGGLDERFLIGDFEDSDLCLKVRDKGLEIACLPFPVTLIHLERQSLSGVGAPGFREDVVRYNAWRHDARWGATIAKMSAADKPQAARK